MRTQHFGPVRRVAVVLVIVVAGVVAITSPAGAQTADQVADQIVAVQASADDAAAQWAQLDAEAKALGVQVVDAGQRVDEAAARVAQLEATLTAVALARYTSDDVQLLPFSGDVMGDVQMRSLSDIASNAGVDDLDAYEAARTDLDAQRQSLQRAQADNQAASDRVAAKQVELDGRLDQLRKLEAELRDEEVRRAYEAKLAALRAKQAADAAAAEQRLAAQTAASDKARGAGLATPSPTTAATPTVTAQPAAPATTTGQGSTPPATSPSAPSPTAPPAAPPTTTPRPAPSIGGLICPVAGPNAFGDSWGDPRSGGRRHEGVDMMSPSGTPLVAVTSGMATMKTNALGGNTVGLKGSDGNYYYYAHLSAWAGSSRSVSQGEVIGYVGHTGDTAADHLHFGIYAGGGAAINPYPIVRPIC